MSADTPPDSGWQELFPGCGCYATGDPSQSGFHELELPDAFRWIRREASCVLKPPACSPRSRWELLITAHGNPQLDDVRLAVEMNDVPIGEKAIPTFGHYYFEIKSNVIGEAGEIKVTLRVNGETVGAGGRRLAIPIYCVKLIDVEGQDAEFDERVLFIDQVKSFRPDVHRLSAILDEQNLSNASMILDIGAGVGWTTVLLAARTGAHATAIDPNHYRNTREFRVELNEMFSRHLSVLRREPGFGAINSRDDLTRAIERCTFLTISAINMRFEDNAFDFVFSLNAFEHIPDPAAAMKEIERVLKPGGEAYIHFHLPYYCDGGSHLAACGLLDKPWAQLLYERDQIRQMIIEAGKVPNEVDNILDSLNGWSATQFDRLFGRSRLAIVTKEVLKGFTIQGAETTDEFRVLKERYAEEDLTTIGMVVHLRKSH